jgi:hypothetical protein
MLPEVKRTSIHSIKEFGKEFAMIVVGILTALSIEHMAVAAHNSHEAEKSRERVIAELKGNLEGVRNSIPENRKRAKTFDPVIAALEEDIRQNRPAAETNAHVRQVLKEHPVFAGVNTPNLRHEAWDLVIADQSLTHIDADSLNRYADIYALQRELRVTIQSDLTVSDAFNKFENISIELEFNRADPLEALKAMRKMKLVFDYIYDPLHVLEQGLDQTLAAESSRKH